MHGAESAVRTGLLVRRAYIGCIARRSGGLDVGGRGRKLGDVYMHAGVWTV